MLCHETTHHLQITLPPNNSNTKIMTNKVVKLRPVEIDETKLQLNIQSNQMRLEVALNSLEELNIEKHNGTIHLTEYYLRKSKIIKNLYTPNPK